MKKLLIAFLLLILANSITWAYSGGTGTSGDPYQISNTSDLIQLSNTSGDWGLYFEQTANIAFPATESSFDWDGDGSATWDAEDQLGFSPISTIANKFTKSYDGQGYEISNLYINRPTTDYVGLFGAVKGIISNLGIVECNITGNIHTGGLIGWTGEASTSVTNCYTTGTVTGNPASAYYVGGLIGYHSDHASLTNSYSEATVSAKSIVGGLIGAPRISSSVSYCYATGDVSATSGFAGGFAGHNEEAIITNCYSTGNVTRSSGSDVTYAGFLGTFGNGTVQYCYSTGSVNFGSSQGFISDISGGTVNNNYYDQNTSGQSSGLGATAKSTSLMKSQGTYSGWNFATTWSICSGVLYNGYPYLQWQVPSGTPASVPSGWSDGNGGTIATLAELRWLSETTAAWDEDWLLGANIDASETSIWSCEGFSPIGNATTKFTGSFDGQDFEISNLYINRPTEDYIGLFGYIYGSTIENLGLVSVNITGNNNTAGLMAKSYGIGCTISGCYSIGSISGNDYVGGLIGEIDATTPLGSSVANCYTTGTVTGANTYTGGFVGKTISCTITKSWSSSTVNGDNVSGGFAGEMSKDNGYIDQCYSTGNVSGTDYTGGFIGQVNRESTVRNCYSTGNVSRSSASNTYFGGFCGYLYTGTTNSTIEKCYSTGDVNFGSTLGFLGGKSANTTVQYCHFDVNISNQSSDAYASAQSTANMKTQSTYTNWDFSTTPIWGMCTNSFFGNGYPYLEWQYLETTEATEPAGYSGTGGTISNLAELRWLSETTAAWDEDWLLGADIDATEMTDWNCGQGFSPIGNITTKFTGNFDGQNYEISNLYINRPATDNVGLFGYVDGSTIENLGLVSVNITGYDFTAGLSGKSENTSVVSNCYVTGSISGNMYIASLIGYSSYTTTSNSYSTALVTGSNNTLAGLIALASQSTISYCYATGNVTGSNTSVTVGGLIGNSSYSTTSNCYATGSVSGGERLGGFVGDNGYESTVSNCYSTGSATRLAGTYVSVGAFCGLIDNSTINYCYSIGSVDCGGAIDKGFIGQLGATNTLNYNFFDSDVSNQSSSAGATAKTTTLMQTQSTYTNWDFATTPIWGMCTNSFFGNGYPYLDWQYPNVTVATAPSAWSDGTGGTISTLAELRWLSETTAAWDEDWLLGADIDASEMTDWNCGEGFSPIGDLTTKFTGSFDGQDYEISNLYINRPTTDYVGFFGYLDGATVENIDILLCDITGNDHTGGLIGLNYNTSTVSKIYVSGIVVGNECVGGLVGNNNNNSVLSNSEASVNVTGNGLYNAGGLVGLNHNYSIVNFSFSTGTVTATDFVGGGVGHTYDNGTISNCYSTGTVTRISGTGTGFGGFCGNSNGSTIEYCYSTGSLDCGGATDKGFLGAVLNSNTFTNNFFDNDVSNQNTDLAGAATPKTTTEMKTQATYTNWDFSTIWTLCTGENNDYPMIIPRLAASAPSGWTDGDGGTISTLAELRWLSETIAAWDENWLLGADIDATGTTNWNCGEGFSPIGNASDKFTGDFDGQDYEISNLYINRTPYNFIGFFGVVANGMIENIALVDCNISGWSAVGGLVGNGTSLSSISNCSVSGNITGANQVGGFAGLNNANVEKSHSSCSVIGGFDVGGFVGSNNNGLVSNCYHTGNVTRKNTSSNTNIGLLCGSNANSIIEYCYAVGSVIYDGATDPTDKGFVGIEAGSNTYTDNFFDSQVSNQTTDAVGAATAKTTAEMNLEATFTNWDFSTIWTLCSGENNDYPMIIPRLAATAPSSWSDGSGGTISTLAELRWLSETIAAWDENWLLGVDIDATETENWNCGLGFSPIGDNTNMFTGSFDGQDYIISNLYINRPVQNYAALFGFISGSTVENIGIIDCDVTGNYRSAGLVAYAASSSVIRNSHTSGTITGHESGVGGIGGIITFSNVSDCYSTADVFGYNYYNAGLIGQAVSTTISNSYCTGDVWGNTNVVGGFVGTVENASTISNCYSTGSVTRSENTTSDTYGGFCGHINTNSTIEYCYSIGSVTFTGSASPTTKAFIGSEFGTNTYTDNFFDSDVSNQSSDAVGAASAQSTVQMNLEATYTNWDFTTIWNLCSGQNNDYPIIKPRVAPQMPTSWTDGSGGTISTLAELRWLSEESAAWDEDWVLGADVDASETVNWNCDAGFTPIGDNTTNFTGSYDGQDYVISNLFINLPTDDNVGFFGKANGATIENLNLTSVDVTGYTYVGSVVGYTESTTITNSSSSGTILGYANEVGGFVGHVDEGNISKSYATGSVRGEANHVGGFAGYSESATIAKCYASGYIYFGGAECGGFIGYINAASVIEDCYSLADVSVIAGSSNNVGGFCGYNAASTIQYCYSIGSVYCGGYFNRGFIGTNIGGTYNDNFWDSEASNQTSNPAGALAKTTAEMKSLSTFTNWDFSTPVWNVLSYINDGYPFLMGFGGGDAMKYSGGEGTSVSPYKIANTDDLLELSATTGDWGDYFILTEDIIFPVDKTTFDWDGDGTATWDTEDQLGFSHIGDNTTNFTGNFDGQDHVIARLYINSPSQTYSALFGYINGATISNLGLASCDITGGNSSGSCVGWAFGGATISECYSSGSVTGAATVGGFIGTNGTSNVSQCYTSCYVSSSSEKAGGFVGYASSSTTSNCYSLGDVTRSAGSSGRFAGFCGVNYNSTIEYCYSTGSVDCGGATDKGFAGENAGTTTYTDNYFDSDVSNQNTDALGSATGKSTSEMTTQSTFATWDFTTIPIWGMISGVNSDYPFLEIAGTFNAREITISVSETTVSLACPSRDSGVTPKFQLSQTYPTDWTGAMEVSATVSSETGTADITRGNGIGEISDAALWYARFVDADGNSGIFVIRMKAWRYIPAP